MRLSQARAESVRRHLIGVASPGPPQRQGYGPTSRSRRHEPEARAKNRRVEFIVEQ